ncbi:MAG: YggS family pyridoxal phosphate-dependent enzyme [Planctomycetes bacterium]|nr:YggS family pyridoxal phosphate-dependent enzyme [Planctomycetota bacterium]
MALTPLDRTRLASNLARVRERIAAACSGCGRAPESVLLVAVTKYAHAPYARALLDLGQLDLGENRVQHLLELDTGLVESPRPRWHMIGHLQKNKVKAVGPRLFALHTLDSESLATRLAGTREGLAPLQVYVQLKLATGALERAGVAEEGLDSLWAQASTLTGLKTLGLMGLPPRGTPEEARPHFRRLRAQAARLEAGGLSMGMTSDLEVAIEEGATVVRVGQALLEGLSDDARLP